MSFFFFSLNKRLILLLKKILRMKIHVYEERELAYVIYVSHWSGRTHPPSLPKGVGPSMRPLWGSHGPHALWRGDESIWWTKKKKNRNQQNL